MQEVSLLGNMHGLKEGDEVTIAGIRGVYVYDGGEQFVPKAKYKRPQAMNYNYGIAPTMYKPPVRRWIS